MPLNAALPGTVERGPALAKQIEHGTPHYRGMRRAGPNVPYEGAAIRTANLTRESSIVTESRRKSCRFCGTALTRTFVDLGRSPRANSLLRAEDLRWGEKTYPLHAYVCDDCLLVQLQEVTPAESIFSDYVYFSSYSQLWLDHCRTYAGQMMQRYRLSAASLVVEVASNDGYLLQYFKEAGIGVLGVEPAANIARVAQDKGIPTEVAFFGTDTAVRLRDAGKSADLMTANNVLPHVPDLHDFVAGFKLLLKPEGTATLEFPHLLKLIEHKEWDTIYHEHFSYFSFHVVDKVFAKHGLRIYDVESLSTHGGSIRIFVCHNEAPFARTARVDEMITTEHLAGLDRIEGYTGFAKSAVDTKCELLSFLIEARNAGKSVAGYGAPAKGNTLLNYCGVGTDLLPYTVDISLHKQGRYLPGTEIPIYPPERIFQTRPDFVLILPWNIKDEIMHRMDRIRDWGGQFVIPIPKLKVLS
jgi:2-polyprenyl-3-methyl-5-hydroxy-6-metoxy-1,4-benzoquinol methylase